MLRRSMFFLEVGGTLITDVVNPLLTSISIKLTAQSKGDTCDVDLNDQGGQISLPPTGAPLRAGIGWDFAPQMFEGKVHKVTSTGSRGGGRMLSIQAQSIARDGKGKERKEKPGAGHGRLSARISPTRKCSGRRIRARPVFMPRLPSSTSLAR